MKKKITIFLIISIVSLCLIFLIFNKYKSPKGKNVLKIEPKNYSTDSQKVTVPASSIENSKDIPVENPNVTGNTPQNIFLGSICTAQDNFYYYLNAGINRVMKDGRTGYKKLYTASNSEYINVSGKYIYFISDFHICKIDLNGENLKFIKDGFFSSLVCYKDKLFFTGSNDGINILYSMDTNGEALEKINSNINNFTIYNDKIIYNKTNGQLPGNTLYISDLQGKNEKVIANSNIGIPGIFNNVLVYCSAIDIMGNIKIETFDITNNKHSKFEIASVNNNINNLTDVAILSNKNDIYLLFLYNQLKGQKNILFKLDLNSKSIIKILDNVPPFASGCNTLTRGQYFINLLDDKLFIPSNSCTYLIDINNNTENNSIPLR